MGKLFDAIVGKPEPIAEIAEKDALSYVTARSIQDCILNIKYIDTIILISLILS